MSKTHGIAYLDHSSLNDMYEGREREIHDFLEENGLKVVFSDENLTEIRNSVVRRYYFIEQLDNLKAFHVYGGSELPEQFTRKVRKPVAFLVPSASGS